MLLGSPGARPCGRATRPGILLSGCLLPGGSSNKSPQGRGCSAAPPPRCSPPSPGQERLAAGFQGPGATGRWPVAPPRWLGGFLDTCPSPPRPRKTPPPCASPTSPLLGATCGDRVGSWTHPHSDPPQHLFSAQSCPGPEPTSPDRNVSTGGGGPRLGGKAEETWPGSREPPHWGSPQTATRAVPVCWASMYQAACTPHSHRWASPDTQPSGAGNLLTASRQPLKTSSDQDLPCPHPATATCLGPSSPRAS